MYKGLNWIGNYSRFSYDDDKNDILVLKEQGRPWLDDEINASQEMLVQRFRRMLQAFLADGSPDDGFKIVGTGAVNNFDVLAGNIHVQGWIQYLAANTTFVGQPEAQLALSTPVADRTDIVYLDTWYAEVNGVDDPTIIDPVIGARTSCRLRLFWAVKVAEGLAMPADGLDELETYHWRYQLATLNRLAGNNTITAGMVQDNRSLLLKLTGAVTRSVAASGNVLATDSVLLVDATAGPVTLTLLSASTVLTRALTVIKVDDSENAVTVQAQAGQTLPTSEGRQQTCDLTIQDESIRILPDGVSHWHRVG